MWFVAYIMLFMFTLGIVFGTVSSVRRFPVRQVIWESRWFYVAWLCLLCICVIAG